MSLYEVLTLNLGLDQLSETHKPQVSEEEWQQAEDLLAAATAHDPSVRM